MNQSKTAKVTGFANTCISFFFGASKTMTVNLALAQNQKRKTRFNIVSMRTPFRLPIAYTCPALQVRLADNRAIPYLSASLPGRCTRRIGLVCFFFWRRRCRISRSQHCRVGSGVWPVKLNVRRFWIHLSQVMPGTGPGFFRRVSRLGVVYSVAGGVLWWGSFAIRIRGEYTGEFGDEGAHELWKDGEGTADDTTGDFGDAICGEGGES